MMSQMYDFSRAQKMRENVTGFLELLHSGGQQWQTSSVNMGSSQVQVYCKHEVTTIPAPGDLTLEDTNSHKGKCLPERLCDARVFEMRHKSHPLGRQGK